MMFLQRGERGEFRKLVLQPSLHTDQGIYTAIKHTSTGWGLQLRWTAPSSSEIDPYTLDLWVHHRELYPSLSAWFFCGIHLAVGVHRHILVLHPHARRVVAAFISTL